MRRRCVCWKESEEEVCIGEESEEEECIGEESEEEVCAERRVRRRCVLEGE